MLLSCGTCFKDSCQLDRDGLWNIGKGSSSSIPSSTYASKTGVAQETIQNTVHGASKIMTEQEARQILGVTEASSWEEIVKKYDTLFERNAKNGSFYLQSKVHKAKECLEAAHQGKGQGTG